MSVLSAALEETVVKLKAQERATAARADASERLNGEIISSLTAGLVMVDLSGNVRILNPAGRRILDLPDAAPTEPFGVRGFNRGRRLGGGPHLGGQMLGKDEFAV